MGLLRYLLENKKLNTYYNMNKKLIRLTEGDLHRIVKESVNRILNESFNDAMLKDDIRRYFEFEKDYDGSASMANARHRMLISCCGDLPNEVNQDDFVDMLASLPMSWSVESLTNSALEWVERKVKKHTAPKIY